MEGIVMQDSKFQRFKKWAVRHEDALITGGAITVVVVLFVVATKANMSYQAKMTAELNGYIDSLNEMYAALSDGML